MRRLALNVGLAAMTVSVVFVLNQSDTEKDQMCREVENIKTALRAEEMERHGNLERNLKILKIESTPEIRKIAAEDHAYKLSLYSPGCPTNK